VANDSTGTPYALLGCMCVTSIRYRRHAARCRELGSCEGLFFPACEDFLELARKWDRLAIELEPATVREPSAAIDIRWPCDNS
jgi:hypothetical protein